MPGTLQCEIVTPEARCFAAEASFVAVPASSGEMGILPKHVPVVSTLGAGQVRVTLEGKDDIEKFAIAGGYVQIQDGEKVIVLADRAINVNDIDTEALSAAKADVEAQLASLAEGAPKRPYLKSELEWMNVQLDSK